MHSKVFGCPNCQQSYDKENRVPKIIPSCGHTVCLTCLDKHLLMKQNKVLCPVDKTSSSVQGKKATDFVTNLSLLQALDHKPRASSRAKELCRVHEERLDLICLVDRCKICKYCKEYGEHKYHEVTHVKNVEGEAKTKKAYLEAMLKDFDNGQKNIDKLYDDEKKMLVQVIHNKFDNLINFLKTKKKEIGSEIGSSFDIERAKVKESLTRDVGSRWPIEQQIASLSQKRLDENFFSALEEPLPTQARQDYENFKQYSQDLQRTLADSLDAMSMSIVSQINHFQHYSSKPEQMAANPPVYQDAERSLNMRDLYTTRPLGRSNNTLVMTPPNRSIYNSSQSQSQSQGERFKTGILNPAKSMYMTPPRGRMMSPSRGVMFSPEKIAPKEGRMGLELNKDALSQERLRALSSLWRQVEQVHDLKIDFHNDGVTDDELFDFFMSDFWSKSDISNLTMNFQGCQVGDQSIITLIFEVLPKLNRLRSINLNLNNTKISDQTVKTFAEYLSVVASHLESFQLGLYNTDVTDDSVSLLFMAMERVREFSLELGNTKITDESLEIFAKKTLLTMKWLETFKLFLYETAVTDRSITELFTNMENVSTYTLELGGTRITDQSIEVFARNTLNTMRNLQSLQLGLYNTEVSDQSISKLFIDMRHIKTFSLNLGNTKVTDNSLRAFAKYTAPSMTQLENFQLYLYNTQVSDQSIAHIFRNMDNVVTFLLDLDNTKITDLSIEAFAHRALQNMDCLQNFQLGLYNTNVTDKSVAKVFTKMETVKKFILDLGKTKITDASIDAFAMNTLPSMRKLERFELYLRNTGVTDHNKRLVAKVKENLGSGVF